MKDTRIVQVWAHALLELASEKGAAQPCSGDAAALLEIARALPEMPLFLATPEIPPEKKKAFLGGRFARDLHPLLLDFISLMVDRHRASLLVPVLETFIELCRRAAGRVRAGVRTAVPMDGPTGEFVRASLEEIYGLKVDIEEKVDPSLLGGIIVRVGDSMIDSSLARYLKELGKSMRSARISTEVVHAD